MNAAILAAIKRRVFFSFHYQEDIWRANQIRNSWRFGHESTREGRGFFDGSLWEKSQRTNDESLKSLIRNGLENTSVTCVLAGTYTYIRRWVRYEIARSVVKGNGLLTVFIDMKKNEESKTCDRGPDPLDYMGVYLASNANIYLAEWRNGKWVRYSDHSAPVTLPSQWRKPTSSAVIQLSTYARNYCYVANNGPENFGGWIQAAAASVGK